MKLEEICEKLQNELEINFGSGLFSVGQGDNTIYIYEHKRGFAKRRVRPAWIPENIRVIYKYIGKIKPITT